MFLHLLGIKSFLVCTDCIAWNHTGQHIATYIFPSKPSLSPKSQIKGEFQPPEPIFSSGAGVGSHATDFVFLSTESTHKLQFMARRSAPPNSGPAYLSSYTNAPAGRRQLQDPNESGFSRFVREQILAPEKLAGNINILTGVGVFVAGIVVARTMGDLLASMVA